MKKKNYEQPEIEVIQLESNIEIMTGSFNTGDSGEEQTGTMAAPKRRNFWDD
jgi:hypothetical protein